MNDKLDNTNQMRALSGAENNQQATRKYKNSHVRELSALPQTAPKSQNRSNLLLKPKFLICIALVFAFFIGIIISGYYHDQQAGRNKAQQDLQEQQYALLQQRQALEKEKNTLHEKQQSEGSNGDSALDFVWQKVQETVPSDQANAGQVQSAIDDIDTKLADLDNMKQQALSVKDKANAVYNENSGTIDLVLYYASEGFKQLRQNLSK